MKNLPTWMTTVTPVSKILAVTAFLIFPMLTFYLGMVFQEALNPNTDATVIKTSNTSQTTTPVVTTTAAATTIAVTTTSDKKLSSDFNLLTGSYPANWQIKGSVNHSLGSFCEVNTTADNFIMEKTDHSSFVQVSICKLPKDSEVVNNSALIAQEYFNADNLTTTKSTRFGMTGVTGNTDFSYIQDNSTYLNEKAYFEVYSSNTIAVVIHGPKITSSIINDLTKNWTLKQ